VKWALYKNDHDYTYGDIANDSWYHVNGQDFTKADFDRKLIPYIWVVNVNSLKDFVNSTGKTYE